MFSDVTGVVGIGASGRRHRLRLESNLVERDLCSLLVTLTGMILGVVTVVHQRGELRAVDASHTEQE